MEEKELFKIVGERLRSFEIANLEGKFFPAPANISNPTVDIVDK